VERQHKLTGRSGHNHTATLYLPERETIIEPITAEGHWNQVTAVYAKFGDLSQANGYRTVTVIDDRTAAPDDDTGKLLLQVSDVVQWSRRQEWMEAVT